MYIPGSGDRFRCHDLGDPEVLPDRRDLDRHPVSHARAGDEHDVSGPDPGEADPLFADVLHRHVQLVARLTGDSPVGVRCRLLDGVSASGPLVASGPTSRSTW